MNTSQRPSVSRYVYTFLIVWLLWYGFTTSLQPAEWIAGGLVAALISFITVRYFECCDPILFAPKHIIWFVAYFFVFLVALVKANFDVARRVLSPRLPINPGIVKFQTRLKNRFARMVLANSITLTPGTLTVDVVGDTYYIHWIDVKTTDPAEVYRQVAEPFERILLKIYGE